MDASGQAVPLTTKFVMVYVPGVEALRSITPVVALIINPAGAAENVRILHQLQPWVKDQYHLCNKMWKDKKSLQEQDQK